VGERHDLRPRSEEARDVVQGYASIVGDGYHDDPCALLLREKLPRNDVRMVLEAGDTRAPPNLGTRWRARKKPHR
jgi:hypothetical protein